MNIDRQYPFVSLLIIGIVTIFGIANQSVSATVSCVAGETPATIDCFVPTNTTSNLVSLRDISDTENATKLAIIHLNNKSYNPGDSGQIRVTDFYANLTNSTMDTVRVKLTSSSDPGGINLIAKETGPSTSTFVANFTLTSGPSNGTSLHEKKGDTIKASYSPVPTFAPSFQIKFDNIGANGTATLSDYKLGEGDIANNAFAPVMEAANFTLGNSSISSCTVSPCLKNGTGLSNPSGPPNEHIVLSYNNTQLGCTLPGCDPALLSVFIAPPTAIFPGSDTFFEVANPGGTCSFCVKTIVDNVTKTISIDYDLTALDSSKSGTWLIVLGFETGGPGGGGGGILRPGLVIDAIAGLATLAGQGGQTYLPPSLSITSQITSVNDLPSDIRQEVESATPFTPLVPSIDKFDFPFYIDGGGYPLTNAANTIRTVTEKTGVPAELKLNIPSSSQLQGVVLYTNIRGKDSNLLNSDTYIIYQSGEPLKISDPHGYFGDVIVNLTTKGIINTVDYKITFVKPMEKSDIYFRIWDSYLKSSDTAIFNAWQVVQPAATFSNQTSSPSTTNIVNAPQNVTKEPSSATEDLIPSIKGWAGYSPNTITDSQLLSEMGLKGNHIPSWFMKTAKWIIDGQIDEADFANAIKFMYQQGIIN